MTNQRLCNTCGKQSREQARFCGYCGQLLQVATRKKDEFSSDQRCPEMVKKD